MSREATVNAQLRIRKTGVGINYGQPEQSFVADVSGNNGPTPGTTLIATSGTHILFSQLTAMGGLCRIKNIDPTNTVGYGVYDIPSNKYLELGMLLPGEFYVLRLSDKLGKEEVGTGTFVGGDTYFHLKARVAACNVVIDAFDP